MTNVTAANVTAALSPVFSNYGAETPNIVFSNSYGPAYSLAFTCPYTGASVLLEISAANGVALANPANGFSYGGYELTGPAGITPALLTAAANILNGYFSALTNLADLISPYSV